MPKPQPYSDPVQTAISIWMSTIPYPEDPDIDIAAWKQKLCEDSPKRFTVYEPMALLPSGSFSSPAWTAELARHNTKITTSLWTLLLSELSKNGNSKAPLTHLAINAGIPLRNQNNAGENVIRSPSGLRILQGDFGPARPNTPPSHEDLASAFWVTTKQNGITQTWAPRWTMFSRGNVKEKARLLKFPSAPKTTSEEERDTVWAVDLYAGIGYFTFCYAKLGMRVLCWELNPWSVEALRRGAHLNRWSVDIFTNPGTQVSSSEIMKSKARIILLSEDNAIAGWRTEDMKRRGGWVRGVQHVNCGFLPTSRLTWDCALSLTRTTTMDGRQAWLHLHENVGEADIERRRHEIEALLRQNGGEKGLERTICVDKVERVKTFAPGVWHCVFDVLVEP